MNEFNNKQDRTVDVKSGHSVILNLDEIDSVPSPKVSWETQRGPITNGIKFYKSNNNQLIILQIDSDEEGMGYRASAINAQIGKVELSPFTFLRISGDPFSEVEPEIVIALDDKKVVKGKETELECVANARPLHEIETLWFKDNVPIEDSGIIYSLGWWNRTLNLLSVDVNYAGEYSCKIQMRTGGYNSKISKGKLEVLELPFFTQQIQTEISTDYGSSIEIPCKVSGTPQPRVKWFRNAEEIDLSSNQYWKNDENSLVINKVNLNDSAVFQCLAYNEAGEKSSYNWIRVKSEFKFFACYK
jgi:protein sidekick